MASVSSSHSNSSLSQPNPNKRRCVDNGVLADGAAAAVVTAARTDVVVTDDNDATKDHVDKKKILPVTLLSGFLGAGKTTLLKQILESKTASQLKIAIIVNDMGALNIDAKTIKSHKLIQEKSSMVEMHNGCICCTLRGDLLKTVKELAMEQKYDYLVIESTGISEPLPVAQTFTMDVNGNEEQDEEEDNDDNAEGDDINKEQQSFDPLSQYARMDTLVTVLDTYNFASILGTIESEADRDKYFGDGEEETDESEESIVQLLVDQIEFANVILLNKIDLLSKESGERDAELQIKAICSLLKKLNPKATVIIPEKPKFEMFDVNRIIDTGLFDIEEVQESAGWIAELEKPHHTPETEEYGIGSFVFRNNERPFHPERLARIMHNFGTGIMNEIKSKSKNKSNNKTNDQSEEDDIEDVFSCVVRCKGELWLSNADCCPIDVHSAGRQLVMAPAENGRPWVAKVLEVHPNGDPASEEANPDDCEAWSTIDLDSSVLAELKSTKGQWTEQFGDRRSEIVFIGIKLDKERLMSELNKALLTDAELNVPKKMRKKVWADNVEDTFFDMPLWDLEDIMGEAMDEDVCELNPDAADDEEDE